MKKNLPGLFVVLEGIDACGKNTQACRLAVRGAAGPHPCLLHLSFPRYETPLGRAIVKHLRREIFVTEAPTKLHLESCRSSDDAMIFQCMMVTDKYDAAPDILEALEEGGLVVSDRWWPSAYAYGSADGLPPEWLLRAHERLPQPDLAILLDIEVDEAHRRRPKPRDRYEEDARKQEDVRIYYQGLWSMQAAKHASYGLPGSEGRWVVVDGSKSEDAIEDEIWDLVMGVGLEKEKQR